MLLSCSLVVVFVHLSLLCESRLTGCQRSLGFATLVSEVGYDRITMSTQSEIPLSEITREDFKRAWMRFELVAKAKEWDSFSTPQGLFEFNVMPFGLTNAPATFQRLMECMLAGLTPEQCLIYLDDAYIIIFSASVQEHLQRLEPVFARLEEAGLKLKLAKCQFAKAEVKYLGHIISHNRTQPDPSKVQVVKEYPPPHSVHQLCQFF